MCNLVHLYTKAHLAGGLGEAQKGNFYTTLEMSQDTRVTYLNVSRIYLFGFIRRRACHVALVGGAHNRTDQQDCYRIFYETENISIRANERKHFSVFPIHQYIICILCIYYYIICVLPFLIQYIYVYILLTVPLVSVIECACLSTYAHKVSV